MAKTTGREEDQVLIKKYSNRRLYDTRQSRYITLEDLAGIIQSGSTVKVVDAATGEELTRQVLMQVILEQQDRLDLLPVELLHAVIHIQGTLQQAPFSAFLSAATQQFVSAGTMWAQQLANLVGAFPGFVNPMAPGGFPGFGGPMASGGFPGYTGPMAGAGSGPVTAPMGFAQSPADPSSVEAPEVSPEEKVAAVPPETTEEAQDLRQRMEALLERLNRKR